jgi:hypothetical protein
MQLLNSFDELFSNFRPAFKTEQTFQRARALAFSSIVTYGRHTITRLICTQNQQNNDWSADYKFFSMRQWDSNKLFFEILKQCDQYSQWYQNSILVALDSTLRKKTSRKIPGVRTLRDPMSLPFHTNLVPGLRLLQASAIIAPNGNIEMNRAIPIYFEITPPAKKPKKNAPEQIKELYKKEQKLNRLSVKGQQAAESIRQQVDRLAAGKQRLLFIAADGAFANKGFLRPLPEQVIPIVRVRKDIKIFKPADNTHDTGKYKRRVYGQRLPTPEEIRQDDNYPWKTATIFGAGKYHEVRYKTVAPVLWQRVTMRQPCRLIIIAALRYRKKKNSKLLYREPAYILVPNVDVPPQVVLQFYFFRWDIEVNNRDEKSIIGLGDAQVRAPESVERNPQFTVAVYSLLLLASIKAFGEKRSDDYLPLPKWRKQTERRPSTLDIISQFRREVMLAQLNMELDENSSREKKNKKHRQKPSSRIVARKMRFDGNQRSQQNAFFLPVNILSALLYADS